MKQEHGRKPPSRSRDVDSSGVDTNQDREMSTILQNSGLTVAPVNVRWGSAQRFFDLPFLDGCTCMLPRE